MNEITNRIIPVKKLSTGQELSINVIEISSKKPGPIVYFQSSVHGAEVQGNLVIFKLIEFFKENEFSGKVIFVPNANPYGSLQKSGPYTQGRFNPVTGNNYNRNYTDLFSIPEFADRLELFIEQDYQCHQLKEKFKRLIKDSIDQLIEQKRSYGLNEDFYLNILLQKIAAEADICLDLHTGPVACEYLYSNSSQKNEVSKMFPFEFVLDIPEEFAGAMDEAFFINYTHVNKLLSRKGAPLLQCSSYTVELGSEELISTIEANKYLNKILFFLTKKGLLANLAFKTPLTQPQKYIELKNYKTYYAPTGGHVEYFAAPGKKISKDETLAIIYTPSFDENGFKTHEIKAVSDAYVINYQHTATVHEGMELYQVGENPTYINF